MSNLPLNIDWQQILLHFFNFVILIGGLYILLYKPIKDFMDKREEHYKQMDDEANAKLQEANAKQESVNLQIANADKDINEAKALAHKQVEEEKALMVKKANDEANKIIEDAKAKAKVEHDKIIVSASSDIKDLASQTVKKILSENSYDKFLDTVSKEDRNA